MTDLVDVAVIGGSFAGLTAALYVARARRSVVVFDHGLTRNRFSHSGHGFLGMDGLSQQAMQARGIADVLAYPTASLRAETVLAVTGTEGAFLVLADRPLMARRVILAYGMQDILPDIPGLAEGWGLWALQCPYCHGYEAADQPTAILMTQDGMPHHAALLRDWTSDLTMLTNGFMLPQADRAVLLARGVKIHDARVARFQAGQGALQAILLADGTTADCSVVYLAATPKPAAGFAADLGCDLTHSPYGSYLAVNQMQATSVAGVFAAGDLCRPFFGAVMAAADGARAGTACHQSLPSLAELACP